MSFCVVGEHGQAAEYLTAALGISRTSGDRMANGSMLDSLGSVHSELGEFEQAMEMHNAALEIHRALGDRRGEGKSLGHLGRVAHINGGITKMPFST